ncbi:MAG: Rieske (2Fe-2S) protein [Candidatus Sumerlaeaceae bacterium]|jgi:nitrite reductase/ring-hydroxylating ferredoxin subunit
MRIFAGKTTDFSEGKIITVWVGPHSLAVVRANGKLCAFHSECPHRGAQLAQGNLEGTQITCPWHAWQFDVATGKGLTNPHARLTLAPVFIEGDSVFLEVPDEWTG